MGSREVSTGGTVARAARLGYAAADMTAPARRAIQIWNRASGRVETEKVFGDLWVRLLYGGAGGHLLARGILSRRIVSRLVGALQSTRCSARRIRPFVDAFAIPMDEYEDREWSSFNDFFIRRFRPGARGFVADPRAMPAFVEARYLAFDHIHRDVTFPVKGRFLTPAAIFDDSDAASFEGGPMLLARLAPVDYHRFHFPDDGEISGQRRIPGRLHSVNPVALRRRPHILASNQRHLTFMETSHFGRLAMVEVGAMNVGRIVQTHPGASFERGQEKGYFCFGASTVLLFGEPGRWRPAADLLEQTALERESLVRLGEEVARAL